MTRLLQAVLLTVLLVVASVAAPAAAPGRLEAVFAELGVQAPAFASAVVTKDLRREGRSHLFWTVVAGLGAKTMRLEISTNMGPEAAGRIIDERAVVIRGLYKPATMDYFGVMSGRSVVPEGLHPVIVYPEKSLLRSGNPVFILWSRRDLTYAVHSLADGVNRGILAFRYCEVTRTLLEVETFEPAPGFDKDAALRDFATLQCERAPAGDSHQ